MVILYLFIFFFDSFNSIQKKDFGIVTFVNYPYKELLLNFICNIENLYLQKYLHIYLGDDKLKNILIKRNITYTIFQSSLKIKNITNYGEDNYWYISKKKTMAFLHANNEYTQFIFTDVDIFWKKNPIDYLKNFCNAEICFQNNKPEIRESTYNKINSGFFFVKTSAKTQIFFENSNRFSRINYYKYLGDQDILNDILKFYRKKQFWDYLDLEKFPNGGVKGVWSPIENKYFILHNNWVESAKDKIKRFREINAWFLDQKKPVVDKEDFQCLKP